ncbi:hypothetical protein GCM10027589_12040 [Actinocorallia lasiicapitis]
MRVELARDIFTQDRHVPKTLALLSLFLDDRHHWVVDPLDVDDINAFLLRHLSPQLAGGYGLMLRTGSRGNANRVVGRAAPLHIPADRLPDAADDLMRPAVVAVEDITGDLCFLRVVLKVTGAQDVEEALASGRLSVAHGGGSALDRVVTRHRDEFRFVVRLAVLFDSDRKMPEDPPKEHAKIENIRSLGARVHVLARREIENYLPDAVLATTSKPHTLSALQQLVPRQRSHIDIKFGYRPDKDEKEQAGLFDDLPKATMEALTGHGFGRKVVVDHLDPMADTLTRADFEALGPGVIEEFEVIVAMLREIV